MTRTERSIFFSVLYKCKNSIEKVFLFGSRARGDYNLAAQKLSAALAKNPADDDMYLDATIQRFEFTFELAWKFIKAILEYEGIEANSPRSSIREGFKANIIENPAKWFDMLEKKNLSTHTYDEETAEEIYKSIKEEHFALLKALLDSEKVKLFENNENHT